MRTAESVLNIIRERGQRGLPLERVYRLLFQRDLYLRAYSRLYANDGAMTRGVTEETVDGMSLAKIDKIIDAVRQERYRWKPARRTYIPKKSGKLRPLGMPGWSDKLLQEVIRSILEAYYEPQFSDRSHGFRPGRGCHTALREVSDRGTGTKWFIEGDICSCFDKIDHSIVLKTLGERIHDNRFLRLVGNLLEAGYLEDWQFHATYSGVPQGGEVTPPTMLQTTLLGASFKRGWTDSIHDANLLLVDLDLLHQRPDDLPPCLPVRPLQPLGDPPRELLQLTDHQP
jgi:hypothetical protein